MLRAMLSSIRHPLAALSCLLVLVAACGGGCNKTPPPAPERTTPGAPEGEGRARDPSDPGTPTVTETTTAGEGGGVALHGDPGSGQIALRLANTGAARVALAAAVEVEQERDGQWAGVPGVGTITLRPSCEAQAPACTTLAPGAELFPPAWLGTTGDSQCACDRCAPVAHGRYRFVVHSCDGARRIAGEPFTLE